MTVAATSSFIGVLAGRYSVVAPVGRGAIAEVVRARDERTGAEVALKILYPHLRESAAVVERFRREVDIVRKISHPNVLAIHEVVDSDDKLFLVMDYHPGGDLADRLAARRSFTAGEIRDLAAQLCGALAAAHSAGVVHRDVKPSNVLCGPGPDRLDVRLCDFGLARAAELSGLTTANAVLGTPEYMAPEVIVDGHADPRSDIYSLGVMLFEAATGRLPFYGDSPYQLMRQHVDVEAPRARSLTPELPTAIDAAIARALAKDPLDRFATVEDLARALADDQPVEQTAALAQIPGSRPARRTCRRCGGWVVEAAGVCADCGQIMLRLDHVRRGVSVIVTGPGKPADKIDAKTQVALYGIIEELPPGSVRIARRRRRAPRVPFYVARGITRETATPLVERLLAIGLHAGIREDQDALVRKAQRQKVGELTWRPLAGFGFLAQHGLQWTPKDWPFWAHLAPTALLGAAAGVALVVAIRNCVAPIVKRSPGTNGAATSRLAALVGRLTSRQDRRLVGHVLERLGQLEALDSFESVRSIAEREADVASALVAFDERRRADASVSADAAAALAELRQEEMMRVIARGELLRVSSWLDRMCLGLSRAAATGADHELGQVEQAIDEVARAIDAGQEVATLLAERR